MTVQELIDKLKQIPSNAIVGEYVNKETRFSDYIEFKPYNTVDYRNSENKVFIY